MACHGDASGLGERRARGRKCVRWNVVNGRVGGGGACAEAVVALAGDGDGRQHVAVLLGAGTAAKV